MSTQGMIVSRWLRVAALVFFIALMIFGVHQYWFAGIGGLFLALTIYQLVQLYTNPQYLSSDGKKGN